MEKKTTPAGRGPPAERAMVHAFPSAQSALLLVFCKLDCSNLELDLRHVAARLQHTKPVVELQAAHLWA